MKTRISFGVTMAVQAVYLFFVGLNFLAIWMFSLGVPYTFPFAIVGHFLLFCLPVELLCLVPNVFFLIMDLKSSPIPPKTVHRAMAAFAVFALVVMLKIALYRYGSILSLVV